MNTTEKLSFQTEVKQLLQLMVHSLYSNREIFLRELISNASDALDKLAYLATSSSNDALYDKKNPLQIHISFNKDQKTLTLSDNGIGMNREEIKQNLGTIAKSGTKEFLSHLSSDNAKNPQLIGQFGVGFYSAFMVADKVTVVSRKAGEPDDEGVQWESAGDGEYTVQSAVKATQGTEVTLHIKEEAQEFLDDWKLRQIISRYSDHISYPILMPKEIEVDAKEDEKIITIPQDEQVNQASALWTRAKSELTEEDYQNFYKHVSHDAGKPLCWAHHRVEGKSEYTLLLYVPEAAPFDLYFPREQQGGVKLYVQCVFILEDTKSFLPNYLRFVRGIIDCQDLPLNVSREILQSNRQVESMKANATKKVLALLATMTQEEPEKYAKFWEQYGEVMKEGPAEDFANREQLGALLRFSSTTAEFESQTVSLDDYISRMKPEQEAIYYVTAESFMAAKNSPHLEVFRQKGVEVLLLSHRVDEWLVSHLTEYKGKKWQSVAKGTLDLGKLDKETTPEETKKAQEAADQKFKPLLTAMEKALADAVKNVRTTTRLTDSPACVVTEDHEIGLQMQRILQAAGQPFAPSKPILEINPEHPLIQKLYAQVQASADSEQIAEWAHVLLDQAILAEGGRLVNPAQFVKRLNRFLCPA